MYTTMEGVRKSLEKLWMLYMEATLDDSGGSGEGIAWEMVEGERGKSTCFEWLSPLSLVSGISPQFHISRLEDNVTHFNSVYSFSSTQ